MPRKPAAACAAASGAAPATTPKVGLALAGGGPLAVVYEIGALAAITEAIDGLDLNDAEIYVGVSAGAIISAALANGYTPHQMCRLFVESDDDDSTSAGAMLFKPETLLRPALREFGRRARVLPGLLAGGALHYARQRGSLASSFERLTEALPAGFLSGDAIGNFLKAAFAAKGWVATCLTAAPSPKKTSP
eukprot:gene1490-1973_t